ncbi:MAG: gliding motility-associated C-terminal domain-containing protein [Anditalea sp.]
MKNPIFLKWYCPKSNIRIYFLLLLAFLLLTQFVSAQTITVTGSENNVNISKVNLTVGSKLIQQQDPTGNTNPPPTDEPVLIQSVVLENGKELFATTRIPEIVNPNPVLGTEQIEGHSVAVINSTNSSVGHMDSEFIPNLVKVVSTPDLRSYWSIGSQPSIPSGETFVDLKYQLPNSGYIMFSERNGNSSVDLVPLGADGKPIPGANTVQIRGYQWNTGVNHPTDVPLQKQWLIVFSASLFDTFLPINGVSIVSINEPDGKLIFFVGSMAAAPDHAGPISNLNGADAVLNVFDNDELNGAPVKPFDVELSVVTPFPENTLTFNEEGTVGVPAGTPPGTYTMTYQITDRVGGESDQAIVTVRVFEQMPEANDDNGGSHTINGADAVVNVLDNDLLNGEPATLENIILSEITNNTNDVLALNPDGSVDVAAGAEPGVYQLTYQICDRADATKCDTAIVKVYLEVTKLEAVDDNFGTYKQSGTIGNILLNDLINGNPVSPKKVDFEFTDTDGLTDLIVEENGSLKLPQRPAPGEYVLIYKLSEKLNQENEDHAEVRFTVLENTVGPILIKLVKTVDKTKVAVGDMLTYTVTLTNNSSFDVTDIIVEDPLPEELMFISGSPSPSGENSWSIPVMAPGETVAIAIEAMAISIGEAINRVTVKSGDYQIIESAETVTIFSKSVDLSITKTSFGTEIYQGNEFEYEIQVENNGDTDASEVVITDNLPEGLSYINTTSTASSNQIEAMPSVDGSNITWTVANFPAGQSLTITLIVRADQLGPKINQVEVTTPQDEELKPSDNMDQDDNEVLAFFIPNVITPSLKDNKNDQFVIKGVDRFAHNKLVIFNRWGDHVFEAENYRNNWTADGLSSGSYFYVLEVTDSKGEEQTFQGWIQVIKN